MQLPDGTRVWLNSCTTLEYAENYGGNTKDTGYTNMVDLRDLAENNRDILTDTCEDVIAALEDCVVYKVNGSYRQQAGGYG